MSSEGLGSGAPSWSHRMMTSTGPWISAGAAALMRSMYGNASTLIAPVAASTRPADRKSSTAAQNSDGPGSEHVAATGQCFDTANVERLSRGSLVGGR